MSFSYSAEKTCFSNILTMWDLILKMCFILEIFIWKTGLYFSYEEVDKIQNDRHKLFVKSFYVSYVDDLFLLQKLILYKTLWVYLRCIFLGGKLLIVIFYVI